MQDINPMWIVELNVKSKNIKILKDNIKKKFFLTSEWAKEKKLTIKENVGNFSYLKTESFSSSKVALQRMKGKLESRI